MPVIQDGSCRTYIDRDPQGQFLRRYFQRLQSRRFFRQTQSRNDSRSAAGALLIHLLPHSRRCCTRSSAS
jgi:hypothetical protein